MNELFETFAALDATAPAVLALAEVLSPASVVEPALLRRARLQLVPHADSGTEADFWFGPWIESRLASGVTFRADAARALQARLARDPARLRRARALIDECHAGRPPAQRAAEELTFLGLLPPAESPQGRVDAILREALVAMVRDDRRRLAQWAARTLPRLSAQVAASPGFYRLGWAAAARLPGGDRLPLGTVPTAALHGELAGLLPRDVARVEVGIARTAGGLVFTVPPAAADYRIELPRTNPLVVELGDADETRVAVVAAAGSTEVPWGPGPVTVATGLQEVYDVPGREGDDRRRPTEYRLVEPASDVQADRPGVQVHADGVHFGLAAPAAEAVRLCLFDPTGEREVARLDLSAHANGVWVGFVAGATPGLLYGYRVDGPYAPKEGQRFNVNKLLLDPYARRVVGQVRWDDALYGYAVGAPDGDLSFDSRDSAPFMPKAMVVPPLGPASERPRVPWHETVLYEAHVRGLTQLHPDVADDERGTYLGLVSPAVIEHVRSLGITTLLLLPVFEFADEGHLLEKGLSNYWGFNPLAFFAPTARYAREDPVAEFRGMVDRMHDAGLEVMLWVPFCRTAEGNELGPTLSLRGIDNRCYRLSPEDPRFYQDFTGTGNTLNTVNADVRRLLLDCLRYWVTEMGVDGFCLELAPIFGRDDAGIFSPDAPFFAQIESDPVLSGVKLIVEPWDVGAGGYQSGAFPAEWRELNDRASNAIRSFWCRDGSGASDLAQSLAGSPAVFDVEQRGLSRSVNFVTLHNGFTLRDLVSYVDKHNEANLEDNRDGHSHNLSTNCGVEGPSSDPEVLDARRRLSGAMLATMLVCEGVPLVLAGDELGQTQHGNNNAWAQDNETTWIDWSGLSDPNRDLRPCLQFIRVRGFLNGPGEPDYRWLTPDGGDMDEADWTEAQALTMVAQRIPRVVEALFNAGPRQVDIPEPRRAKNVVWRDVLTSAINGPAEPGQVAPRSLLLRMGVESPDQGA